ncbi:transporter protein [Comamonas phosphati]|nr:transporter protein [Comamonas phosphati]
MWLGLSLFYVGAVLCLNGLWMLGRIADKEIWVINLFTGLVSLCIGMASIFGPGADALSVRNGALTLLFAFTYLWVAFNRFSGADGRGLGWFSLFVAITAVPVAFDTFAGARSALDCWMGINWTAWAVLWALFFVLLALRKPIDRLTGVLSIVQGVLTGWLPGYLILAGKLG